MIVWALFDSGNGSYTKGVKALNSSGGLTLTSIQLHVIVSGRRSLKILRLRNKIGSGKQDKLTDIAIQETEVKNAAF